MSISQDLVAKTHRDITEADLQFYIDILAKGIRILVDNGDYSCYEAEMDRVETDLRHLFRDDKSILIQYLEGDEIMGLVAVRELGDKVIFVHQCHPVNPTRAPEIMRKLLFCVKHKYPGYSSYGITHKSNKALEKFCSGFGGKTCDTFRIEEHPASTQENGWVSWMYQL